MMNDIAEYMVPCVNGFKKVIQKLDETSDASFGRGVLAVDKAFQLTEALTRREYDDIKREYAKSRVSSRSDTSLRTHLLI